MNTNINRKTRAMLVALPALVLSTNVALAAPTFQVAGTVNAYPAAQIQGPYQYERAVADSSTCAPQCTLTFPTVPVGKRLVITNVSAQTGMNQSGLVIEGNGVAFFVPKNYPTAGTLAAPVTVYFEADTAPTARFFVPNAADHTSLVVTLVGYLVPAK